MLALILNLYRIKFIKPGITFQLITSLLKFYYRISRKKNNTDFNRFIRANKLPNSIRFEKSIEKLSIELIIVASRKDFDVINKTLKVTLSKLSNFNSINISIIVPRADLELAKNISLALDHKVLIVDEYQILDSDFLNSLKKIFSSRATWVYQQALKLNALSKSESNYAMILDADTVILNSRTWLYSNKKLMLTPSDEYVMEYYNFLKCINECCDITATYGNVNEKPKYCKTHKLDDMIDLTHKKCKHDGCLIRPSYNFEEESIIIKRNQYQIIDANNPSIILEHFGEKIEVIGKIGSKKSSHTKKGDPYTFLNFGAYFNESMTSGII
jgi:hypothetical protein